MSVPYSTMTLITVPSSIMKYTCSALDTVPWWVYLELQIPFTYYWMFLFFVICIDGRNFSAFLFCILITEFVSFEIVSICLLTWCITSSLSESTMALIAEPCLKLLFYIAFTASWFSLPLNRLSRKTLPSNIPVLFVILPLIIVPLHYLGIRFSSVSWKMTCN